MTSFRNLWSKEEDSTLRREVAKQILEKGGIKDWRGPAAKLPGRNNKDCRRRWLKLRSPVNKGVWSEEENNRLREAVQVHGRQWVEVAKSIKTRNADQCAKRWLHFLDPGLDYSEWTGQEDEYLIAEVERNGRNWRKIVNEVLPGRSATDAKNRFNKLQRGKQSRKGSVDGEAYKSSKHGSLVSNTSDSSRGSWSPSDACEDNLANLLPERSKSPDLMAIDSEEVGTTEALCPVSSFEEMMADQQECEADSSFVRGPMELCHQCPLLTSHCDWNNSAASSSNRTIGFSRQTITDFDLSGSLPSNSCTSRSLGSSAPVMTHFSDSIDYRRRSRTLSVDSESSPITLNGSAFSVDLLTFADPLACSDTEQWARYPAISGVSSKVKSERLSDCRRCPDAQHQ